MRRILFIGDLREHTRSSQRMRELAELGHEVTGVSTVSTQAAPPNGQRVSALARIRHRLGRPEDPTGANRAVQGLVTDETFDVLWVEKAQSLRSSTLLQAANAQPEMRLVFFSEDDMTLASNQSAWFRKSLPFYDLVVTTKSQNAREAELPALGARRVFYVAKTFDPNLHRPLEVSGEDRQRLGAPVGFIGTFEEPRAKALLTLARSGLDVRVWGNGWAEWTGRHARLTVENRAIYGEEYVRALCATDVNLGFLRKASRDLHTDRSVEIPACGAFLLAERTDEHLELFEEGREAEYFGDLLELTTKTHHYLAHPDLRREIARAGRGRALESDYAHGAALRRILATLEEAHDGRRAG